MINVIDLKRVRVPIIYRVAVPLFVLLALLLGLVRIMDHGGQKQTVQEPPPALLPGKQQFPTAAGCESFHYGRFVCHVYLNDSTIEVSYDGIAQRIIYTYVSTPNEKIGDLINAWGNPASYTRIGQVMVVFWNTRAAYLAPNSFRPDTLVNYVSFGDWLMQAETCSDYPCSDTMRPNVRWHGFVSEEFFIGTR